MAKLIARPPCAGLLPQTIGALTLTEVDLGQVTLVTPFKGQKKAVSDGLKAALGVGFPAPNRMLGTQQRALWVGMDQALICGAPCPDLPAACVDQSDGYAVVRVEGGDARDVLARLTPIDLRASVFKKGHTARTLIGHMTASVTCLGANRFEVMVMRSMAGTLVHELSRAAQGVAARSQITH